MDPLTSAAAAAQEPDPSGSPTDLHEDVKMEEGRNSEAIAKPTEATDSEPSKPNGERHDSVFSEDTVPPELSTTSAEAAENKTSEARDERPESVIQEDRPVITEPKAAESTASSTRKELNLGTSILQTASVAASSKPSSTLSPHSSPSLGSSILKTPAAPAPSKQLPPPLAKSAGSTWVYSYGGKLWPVVLCDEKLVPQKFMASRRKDCHLPAILLGKRVLYVHSDISA